MKIRKGKLTQSEKRNQALFWFGLIWGFAGGIIGNIMVSSANNILIKSCEGETCFWSRTFAIVGGVIFVFLIIFMLIQFDKIVKGLNKK